MDSLFDNLLRIIKNDKIPFEDFFTEIFVYVLKFYPLILQDFVEEFDLSQLKDWQFSIATQNTFSALEHHFSGSRPDIYIELFTDKLKDILLIECKIDAPEGYEQLKRYAEHLDSFQALNSGLLVYITRDYDPKNKNEIFQNCKNLHRLNFIQLRWHEVYYLLRNWNEHLLVQQFLIFMENNNMASNNQFSTVDILSLTNFNQAMKIMEETIFGEVYEGFKNRLNQISPPVKSMSQLRNHNRYIILSEQNEKMWCFLGYWLESSRITDYPKIGLIIEIEPNSQKRNEVIEIMKNIIQQEQRNWKGHELNGVKTWSNINKLTSLQEFLSGEDHVKSIKNYFLELLEEIDMLKQNYPQLPWR